MKYCEYCGTENVEEASYCNHCGASLTTTKTTEPESKNTKYKTKKGKSRKKTKVKKKTKTKYETKTEKQTEKKMGCFAKIIMALLILMVLGLGVATAILGYHIYKTETIVVPDVTGLSYEDARVTLAKEKLEAKQKEKLVTDEEEVGIVLSQSKRAGRKAKENAVITLTVGVLDTTYKVPDLKGKTEAEAVSVLEENNIRYQIVYEESNEKPGVILDILPKVGTVIEKEDLVVLTVSKEKIKEEEPTDPKEPTVSADTE